ncbi:pleckstriny domain-containing family J member 1-like protein [Leptotrombidium deliense]|uniref:Pleckstrin homology domain-containing family J member 1 n=1 Tax=Leptotrombidium deliense TaxID=299467 RepID=A0A443S405_9ACAR|nr:pleckstriny domain-containing family J member 1-like protein [Leptotrombidium deliense]
MKLNEREISDFSTGAGDKEGKIYHKTCTHGSFNHSFKERWFKLKGNLLFYYKVNEYGGINSKEPIGFYLLEDFSIQFENDASFLFAFSITFDTEPDKKHIFGCRNQQNCDEWISILQVASYQKLKSDLFDLQLKIIEKTGSNPLLGTMFFTN